VTVTTFDNCQFSSNERPTLGKMNSNLKYCQTEHCPTSAMYVDNRPLSGW